ncbi:hypothetical protein ACFLQI_01390 [Candidatus Undinarchaeota archaeon]
MKLRLAFIPIFLFLILAPALAVDEVHAYMFWAEGCPHCHDESLFLDTLEEKYPELEVHRYELTSDVENQELFLQMGETCGFNPSSVPTLIIGEETFVGYRDELTSGREIEKKIVECIEDGCKDAKEITEPNGEEICEVDEMITLPIFGEVSKGAFSLPVFTIIIGLLDGFNPCAMWVLTFLIAVLVYTDDKKKMMIIGGIFIFVSGLVYYLFIAAAFNIVNYLKYMDWLRILVGLGAIFAGLVNLKDFFYFGKGFSLSISAKHKKRIVHKMNELVKQSLMPATILGIIALAITVNFVELLCTAGFPVIYSSILAFHNLPPMVNYLYFGLYILMYMIDDLAIFSIAVYTMTKHKFTKKEGKLLKLISGLMITLLGLILILRPELLMFG